MKSGSAQPTPDALILATNLFETQGYVTWKCGPAHWQGAQRLQTCDRMVRVRISHPFLILL